MTVFEGGGGVEFGGCVVTAQSGIAQSDGMEGKLERGGKRIPVRLEWVGVGGGGNIDVEIVDLQTAGELRRGE